MRKKFLRGAAFAASLFYFCSVNSLAAGYTEVGEFGRPFVVTVDTPEQIEEEILLGEMEMISQLVEAEAGNQPFEGKVKVAEVIINRIESENFPDTAEEVIFQPGQFSVTTNGAWEKAAYNMKEDDYTAVEYAFSLHEDKDVLYFNNCSSVSGRGAKVKIGGHWFRNG